ncbi:hypothetical protein GALMADRAFT_444591 [Galerina marginata CBS 339.88]|uniref:Uncharacterized protein n=1 Tax=Galerina marginata (strain CBS 339.88) TaxID=685588 RepID=A0A067SBR0_GALM3|nr:hypothetical protein GALMADRAFT_444591 [Galerina marginata CBS 339.88]
MKSTQTTSSPARSQSQARAQPQARALLALADPLPPGLPAVCGVYAHFPPFLFFLQPLRGLGGPSLLNVDAVAAVARPVAPRAQPRSKLELKPWFSWFFFAPTSLPPSALSLRPWWSLCSSSCSCSRRARSGRRLNWCDELGGST